MIKVEHTKTQKLLSYAFIHTDKEKSKDNIAKYRDVLVAPAKLVLVEVKEWDEYCLRRVRYGNIFYNGIALGIDTILLKPILISETEKINLEN